MKRRHVVKILRVVRDIRCNTYMVAFIFAFALLLAFSLRTVSNAGVQHVAELSYESIRINEGDTLWDIADEYMCCEFKNKKALVDEIARLNHIGNENVIHDGGYLVVPVYIYR